MSAQNSWHNQLVQAFFEACNWQGVSLVPTPLSSDLPLHQSLQLQSGSQLLTVPPQTALLPIHTERSIWQCNVQEFFHKLPWERSERVLARPIAPPKTPVAERNGTPPKQVGTDSSNIANPASASWMNQTVQAFFAGCNWQGTPLRVADVHTKPDLPAVPQVLQSSQSVSIAKSGEPVAKTATWLQQSVQTFFLECNWQGMPLAIAPVLLSSSKPVLSEPVLPPASPTSDQPLSPAPLSVAAESQPFPWKATVADFLQAIPWEGGVATNMLPVRPVPASAPANKSVPVPEVAPVIESVPAAASLTVAPEPLPEKPFELPAWRPEAGAKSSGQSAWLCQSVQTFFETCNWQGMLIVPQDQVPGERSLNLTLMVAQFFQTMPWEGRPKIGAQPKLAPIPEENEPANPINLAEMF